jgi:hypothetical protein
VRDNDGSGRRGKFNDLVAVNVNVRHFLLLLRGRTVEVYAEDVLGEGVAVFHREELRERRGGGGGEVGDVGSVVEAGGWCEVGECDGLTVGCSTLIWSAGLELQWEKEEKGERRLATPALCQRQEIRALLDVL